MVQECGTAQQAQQSNKLSNEFNSPRLENSKAAKNSMVQQTGQFKENKTTHKRILSKEIKKPKQTVIKLNSPKKLKC